jgi:hypothetical protein
MAILISQTRQFTANEQVTNAKLNDIASSAVITGISASDVDLSSIAQVMAMASKTFKLAKGADVASAAGNIALGEDGNYFDITGTLAITSITAKQAGTIVVLQFDSTATLTDGSNLKLQSNFTGAAEAQIILVSDGTNWFEVARNLPAATATRGTFVNGDLSTGVLTVTHSKALSAPYSVTCKVFDNNAKEIIPDAITGLTNTFTIDLTSYGTLSGTWGYIYIT